jgi:hypothetical protein
MLGCLLLNDFDLFEIIFIVDFFISVGQIVHLQKMRFLAQEHKLHMFKIIFVSTIVL